jgi:[histone H3]-lysine36 N-trimethyltransferase
VTQLTQIIADKEKKSSSYKEWKLDQLSDEKVAKIKKFAKEYIAKVLRKLEKSGHRPRPRPPSSTMAKATSSASLDTPNSAEGVDGVTGDMSMSVEEAMDMDPDSDSDSDSDGEHGDEEGHKVENGINGFSASMYFSGTSPRATRDVMDVDESHDLSRQPSDPRRRPPVGYSDSEWDPRPLCMNGMAGMS